LKNVLERKEYFSGVYQPLDKLGLASREGGFGRSSQDIKAII
jgi:hypothetical protein